MSQQSDMADAIYSRLSSAPVSVAQLARELRERWGPDHDVPSIHLFVSEVARCLLHHDDVETGDVKAGTFEPWKLRPEDVDQKIENELMALDALLDDESRYVFRRRPAS